MTTRDELTSHVRGHAWLILLARATLALGLGLTVVITGQFRPGMANVIALYWLLGAVVTLRWARLHRGAAGARVAASAGIVAIIASAAILGRDLLRGILTEERALVVVGAMSILVGLLRASGLFRESVAQDIRRARPEGIALGGLEIALGLVLVLSDELKPFAIPMVGIWGLVGGTIMAMNAFRTRRALQARSAPQV